MTKQRTGDELIVFDNMPIGKSLSDYWRWNASDYGLFDKKYAQLAQLLDCARLFLDTSSLFCTAI